MKTFFFTLFSIAFFAAIAQSGLTGQLIDDIENTPIEFGSIAIYNQKDSTLIGGTITSSDGTFEILGIRPGNYFLTAQFVGYETTTIDRISLLKNSTLHLGSITMKTSSEMLDEIEVSGESFAMLYKADRQVFEASKFQSSTGGTATDVLRNLPSVTVNALGQISARGTSGFVILINGKPIQADPQLVLNQIPANAISNVELITAPSAKYDPEGKAGIINIITNRAVTDGTFFQINTRIGAPSIQPYDNADYTQRYGGDFIINHRKGNWDISGGASFQRNDLSGRRIGDVYTIINDTLTQFPSNGERSFDEVNYSGRFTLGYTPNKQDNFSLGFFAGKRSKDRTADIVYYDNHGVFNNQRLYTMQYYNENLRIRTSDFILGSLDYSHSFNNESELSTSFLYEYTLLGGPTTNRNLGYPETSLVYQDEYNTNDNPLKGVRYQLDYKFQPYSWGVIEAGYQFRYLNHIGDFVYERKNNTTGVFELVPDFSSEVDLKRIIHSGYTQLSGKKDKLSYGLGLRIEMMDRSLKLRDKAGTIDTVYNYDFIQPYPSANLQYAIKDDFRLKAAYSRRVERTTTFKMNPFPEREHSETLEQGDPQLLPEFINLVELGMEKDFGDNSIFATAYFRDVKNLVNRVNTIYNDTILNRIYSNVGLAKSVGLEIGSDSKITDRWNLLLGGNIYHYAIDGSFDSSPINTSSWIYSINANTTYQFGSGFNVQWALNYISAQNTAQGKDSMFLSPNLTIKKTFLNDRLAATLQWLNMDLGLLDTNEQRITTWRDGEFYTTTNYVYEVDMVILNLSYSINKSKNKARFIKSEFGEKEF
ncbi:MAG: TonB-dependent receptor domain-containing protein [Bacteroidota bacterium]